VRTRIRQYPGPASRASARNARRHCARSAACLRRPRPLIGQFQAIQHKLADCLIKLDGARLAIEAAADACDRGDPAWKVFANAAIAFAGPALRAASVETHRALGAIGYAEEHEAPRHFRRVHVDLARFGGVQRARAELADFLLGPAETQPGGTA
jgi:alkylation response protein AidB-like acyl-CoA dehydrogenase